MTTGRGHLAKPAGPSLPRLCPPRPLVPDAALPPRRLEQAAVRSPGRSASSAESMDLFRASNTLSVQSGAMDQSRAGKPANSGSACPEQDQGRPGCPEDADLRLQRDGFIQGTSRRDHEGGFSLESGEGAAAVPAEAAGKTRRPRDFIHADPGRAGRSLLSRPNRPWPIRFVVHPSQAACGPRSGSVFGADIAFIGQRFEI